jgi:cystathionine gamma-lyase
MRFATKLIHGGLKPDPATGSVNIPIYQTSNFAMDAPGIHKGYTYSRVKNPTRESLEKNIAVIENGKYGLCFASGVAAIDAILRMYKPGDEIITTTDLYGGSLRLFRKIFQPAGIHFRYVDLSERQNVVNAISRKTKLIWVESPTNPMMNILDIAMIVEVAHEHNVHVVVDNTFATPCLQKPLDFGADIVMHSATKYLGGHSDLILGAVVVNHEALYEKLKLIQVSCGAIPGPNDCFLTLRGIKTLQIRMERSCANAYKIAHFLDKHPGINKVNYPGLSDHPGHKLAKRQMADFGAMISFDLLDDTKASAAGILEKMQIFTLAESLGGVESLCGHPATMSHASMPGKERLEIGIHDSMIRLSVGIEDVDDLIEDLKQAFAKL